MAEAFLEEGAKVAVNGRKNEAVAKFRENHAQEAARAFEADVADYAAMEAVAESVVQEWGGVDILVNNAGIVNPLVPSAKIKREDFDRVIDVNLKGTFYVTQIFGRKMLRTGLREGYIDIVPGRPSSARRASCLMRSARRASSS